MTERATPLPSNRQTLSYLQQMLSKHELKPKPKLGQNFLIDLNLLQVVMRHADLGPTDMALEIGTGTGSLTAQLALAAGSVLSIEIDPDFHALAMDHLGERPNVRLLHGDALKNKNLLNPDLLQAISEQYAQSGSQRIKLIANLPYSVAVPVIANLLLTELPIERMVVMVQWEIAERLVAEPSSKEYGALSVLVQSLARVKAIKSRISPTVFWPRPQVASAMIGIWPDAEKRAIVGDVHRFRIFLRDLYAHRRKNLRGALAALAGKPWSKAQIDSRLVELGIAPTVRAEALGAEQHLALCRAFAQP